MLSVCWPSASRPLRARGLKRVRGLDRGQPVRVAPLAGAWIETSLLAAAGLSSKSRPLRARGLKHHGLQEHDLGLESRPLRARGLKHHDAVEQRDLEHVAPLRARGLKPRDHGSAL